MKKPPVTGGLPSAVCALVLACTLASSCTPAGDAPPLAVERDSAGITIVESFAPAWGDSARWRVGAEPLLDLAETGTGDAHEFYRVRNVTRLPDGGIAVVNRGSSEIRKFSADGAFAGSVGGYGEGPGEFSNLQQVELVGDSMLVRDVRRVALFGPDLRHVRTLPLHPGSRSLHYLDNGTMVAPVIMDYPEEHGLVRAPEVLLVYDLEGARRDSIGATRGSEEYVTDALMGFPLFGKTSVLDTHGDRIFLGSSDYMQVEEVDANGDTLRILRIPDYPLTLAPEEVRAERNLRLNPPLPPGVTSLPPPIVEAVEGMPSPETRPAYADLLVDPTGAVWLRPFRGSSEQGGPEHWLVLGADGSWLGSVEMPENLLVREIGVDEILGVWTSELDVQHPQVWRLRR
ncbi:MAG: hypothetical protein F4Y07_10515 [Gemmatimonadetes bacterium]|nr:hypothetical protein [Gemmatimonadota bacterium]